MGFGGGWVQEGEESYRIVGGFNRAPQCAETRQLLLVARRADLAVSTRKTTEAAQVGAGPEW